MSLEIINSERINNLEKKLARLRCSLVEVFISDTVADGDPVLGCYKFAINSVTEEMFFKSSTGVWELIETGAGGASGSGLISGGIVSWLGGFNYNISPALYKINGVTYSSPSTNVTLDPSDPTLDRIDSFVLNTSGQALVITGTPDANPASPSINPENEIEVGIALVQANTTEPATLRKFIYRENLGSPDEFSGVSSNNGRLNLNSSNTPIVGSINIEATAAQNGDNIVFTDVLQTFSIYNTLVFTIKSKAIWNTSQQINITFYDGVNPIGTIVILKNGSFGFDSGNTTTSQIIAIPLLYFNLNAQVDSLKLELITGGPTFGFFIDDIQVQEALISNGIGNSFWLSNGSSIFNSNPGSVGIGETPNLLYKLDVKGDTRLGKTTTERLFLGNGIIFDVLSSLPRLNGNGNGLLIQNNKQTGDGITLGLIGGQPYGLSKREVVFSSGDTGVSSTTIDVATSKIRLIHSGNSTQQVNMFHSSPTIQQTGGTGSKLRGFYHNPILNTTLFSENIAFENTTGDIIHGNLSGVGTRMVVADSTGKLSTQAIPSGGGGSQDLQSVTDIGGTTTNNVTVAELSADVVRSPKYYGVGSDSFIIVDGGDNTSISFGNYSSSQGGTFNFGNISTQRTWDLPNSDGTFALLADIPVDTLQTVTDNDNSTTNNVYINNDDAEFKISDTADSTYAKLRVDSILGLGDPYLEFKNFSGLTVRIIPSSTTVINDTDFKLPYINPGQDTTLATRHEVTYIGGLNGADITIGTIPAVDFIEINTNGSNNLVFPDPSITDGKSVTIINSTNTPVILQPLSIFNPYDQGKNTQLTSLDAESMYIFKAINGKWRGGKLS